MSLPAYHQNVFINCPFDRAFRNLLESIVFTVHDCGFVARSALEADDSSQVRIAKIYRIISDCHFGVHDLSRTELDPTHSLPRFNMPLELGIFLGAKRFGDHTQQEKNCLILDREPFRYQKFCSDIAGQDVRAHDDDPDEVIRIVRNWLRNGTVKSGVRMPGVPTIRHRYRAFRMDLPVMADELGWDPDDLIFNDYTTLIASWLLENPW
jgi:hypothetical protein